MVRCKMSDMAPYAARPCDFAHRRDETAKKTVKNSIVFNFCRRFRISYDFYQVITNILHAV